jgi:predicted nucleotidyltransferase
MSDPVRDSVLEILQINQDNLRRYGVRSSSLFGSVARGESGPRSDVDLLVDVDDDVSLFGLSRLKRHLEDLLGMPVDLVTTDALRPSMRDQILAEAIRAAECSRANRKLPHYERKDRGWCTVGCLARNRWILCKGGSLCGLQLQKFRNGPMLPRLLRVFVEC